MNRIPYIDIHTHRSGPLPDVVRVCAHRLGHTNALPDSVFTAGVHPWDVVKADASVLDFFDEKHPGLVGVGEIGLDFSLPDADRALQTEWLDRQLALAERLGLPVVLHCVRAYNEMQAELKKYRLPSVVFHGFIGSPELTGQLTGQGYYLSFSAASLHSTKSVEALKVTPPDRLFLETDDDPQTSIEEIYARAAAERGMALETLKAVVYDNYSLGIALAMPNE